MAYRTAVVGGSGYMGAELLRILAGHPEMEVVHVTADSNAGAPVSELYPSLARAYPHTRYAPFDPADAGDIVGLDVVFLALPHGESQQVAPGLLDRVGHVVDLGADFRLPAPAYEQWYGRAHAAPALLSRFSFGLAELFRDDVISTEHVAAPGCYPTAAVLALAPLLAEQLVEPTGLVVDAVSGVSGAGRGLSARSLFSEANENATPYGLLDHRHTGEMEYALGRVARTDVRVLFTPHLVPMTRGVLATCHARPAADGLSTEALLAFYREFYADAPFVIVTDEPPATKAMLAANTAQVTVRFDPRTGSVLAFGALDNLGKGGSGQAIQCANLLLGLPETSGLAAVGVMP